MTPYTVASGSDRFTFNLCTTSTDVDRAISTLSQHAYVLLDCEGLSIGTHGGALSLICMGTPLPTPDQSIFVIDMVALANNIAARTALAEFLTRAGPVKLIFDGRKDKTELDAALGIDFGGQGEGNVIDLQLAEVLARRRVFGENERKRQNRLASARFNPAFVQTETALLTGIDVVLGMDKCVQDYAPAAGLRKDDAVKTMHKLNQGSRWMARPLERMLATYAATDIRALAHIFGSFVAKGVVPATGPDLEQLRQLSARYVGRNGVRGRVPKQPTFGVGALVFTGALAVPAHTLLPTQCAGCGSRLPQECFQTAMQSGRQYIQQHCRACVVTARYAAQKWRDSRANDEVKAAFWVAM